MRHLWSFRFAVLFVAGLFLAGCPATIGGVKLTGDGLTDPSHFEGTTQAVFDRDKKACRELVQKVYAENGKSTTMSDGLTSGALGAAVGAAAGAAGDMAGTGALLGGGFGLLTGLLTGHAQEQQAKQQLNIRCWDKKAKEGGYWVYFR